MARHETLLPSEATPFERLMSDVNDEWVRLSGPFVDIETAWANPPPAFLPFRIWELGLGPLSPYLPNAYDLIAKGVKWQRIRGTPAAIAMGLGWIGYSAALEEEPARRRLWNRYQLALSRVRDADDPDLRRIAGIASLSVPARSIFWRGFCGYDVRACEASYQKASACLASDHSGVRLPGVFGSTVVDVKTQWSFGRRYDQGAAFTQADLEALGVWIPPVGVSDRWVDANYRWDDANFAWSLPGEVGRRKAMAEGIVAQGAYVRFSAADGSVIGYALATLREVSTAPSGPYVFGGQPYRIDLGGPEAVAVIASSDFGDAAAQHAASVSVLFGATRAPGIKPGRNWLGHADLTGGVSVASSSVSIPFGLTVREQVRFLLRF